MFSFEKVKSNKRREIKKLCKEIVVTRLVRVVLVVRLEALLLVEFVENLSTPKKKK